MTNAKVSIRWLRQFHFNPKILCSNGFTLIIFAAWSILSLILMQLIYFSVLTDPENQRFLKYWRKFKHLLAAIAR